MTLLENASATIYISFLAPSLDVPRFDDDIRLQRWFVANTSHNCLRLSYTNKQTNQCSYARNIWYCIMNDYFFLSIEIIFLQNCLIDSIDFIMNDVASGNYFKPSLLIKSGALVARKQSSICIILQIILTIWFPLDFHMIYLVRIKYHLCK